jgi:hypothetical protein
MVDFLQAALRLMLALILDVALYRTGRLLLPLISLGHIKVAALREPSGRARALPARPAGDIVAGYGWCRFIGFLFWASVILMLAHCFGRPA